MFAVLLVACNNSSSAGIVPKPLGVSRGPQVSSTTSTTTVVSWRSDYDTLSAVEFGATLAFGQQMTSLDVGREHVFVLTNLLPNALYHYRLLVDGEPMGTHFFRTAPDDPSATFRFVAFGDSGSATQAQRDVAEQVDTADPDLVIIAGDVIYENGAAHELQPAYFTPYRHLIDHIPFFPSLGNHDVRTDGGDPLLGALYLPTNNADSTERYYSFDWAGAHFVALNTNDGLSPGSLQYDWLESDLAATVANWIFVYFHHPPYSSSLHGSDLDVRDSLAPLFDTFGVDVVFTGHDHDYERTFPLFNDVVVDSDQEPDYEFPGGTIYIVTGGGGRGLYGSGTGFFTAFSRSVHHHVEVDVEADEIRVTAVASDGGIVDAMTVRNVP